VQVIRSQNRIPKPVAMSQFVLFVPILYLSEKLVVVIWHKKSRKTHIYGKICCSFVTDGLIKVVFVTNNNKTYVQNIFKISHTDVCANCVIVC
jgi:hypothetical protein